MHCCAYPTVIPTLPTHINKPLLSKITPPTILYYPIARSIPNYLHCMVDLRIRRTLEHPKRILLPPSRTHRCHYWPILQHTYYRTVASVVLRYPCLVRYHHQIFSRTHPIIIGVRLIGKTTFQRQSTLQCLVDCILQISPRTAASCCTFQQVLFRQIDLIDFSVHGSALQNE